MILSRLAPLPRLTPKLISDGKAESDRIRPTTKDPKLQRIIRMDNGQDRITSRQEE